MKSPLLHLASVIFDSPLAIIPEKLETILHAIGPRLTLDQSSIEDLLSSGILPARSNYADLVKAAELKAIYGRDTADNSDKPYCLTDAGIAIIPISGVLMKKGSWMSALSGSSSYEGIGNALACAMDDPDVRGILFDVNSPGGTTHGCFELSDKIYQARGQGKPICAVANDLAASAAYALASAADDLWLTRTAAVGSIGVYAMHQDVSGMDAKLGVKYTFVHAGEKKVDGNPHERLSRSARADIQSEVDREYDIFTSTVARNRDQPEQLIVATEAGCLFAELAVPLLADQVGTFDDALQAITDKVLGMSASSRATLISNKSRMNGSQVQSTLTNKASVVDSEVEVEVEAVVKAETATETETTMPSNKESNKERRDRLNAVADYAAETDNTSLAAKVSTELAALDAADESTETSPEPGQSGQSGQSGQGESDMAKLAQTASQTAALEAKDKDEKEMKGGKKAGKKADDYADAKTDPDDDEDDDEKDSGDDDDEDNDKKKAGKRADMTNSVNAEAVEIAELCTLAGVPQKAAKFLIDGKSAAAVRKILAEKRAKESDATSVSSTFGIPTNADSLSGIVSRARQAAATAKASGQLPSAAYEAAIRANPDLYMAQQDARETAAMTRSGAASYMDTARRQFASMGLGTGS